jgi:GTP-binding protein EngB required for normal cell division
MKEKFEIDLGTYVFYPFLINFRYRFLSKLKIDSQGNLLYLKKLIEYYLNFLRIKNYYNYKYKLIKIIISPQQKKEFLIKNNQDYFYKLFFKKNKKSYVIYSLIGPSDLYNIIKFIYQENINKNYSIIHAASVLNKTKNQVIVIFGKSNTGKSTFASLLTKKSDFIKISDDTTLIFFKKNIFFITPIFIDYNFFSLIQKVKDKIQDQFLDLKVSAFIYLNKSRKNNVEEINNLNKKIYFFKNIENINLFLINKLITNEKIKLIKINFFDHNFKDLISEKIINKILI